MPEHILNLTCHGDAARYFVPLFVLGSTPVGSDPETFRKFLLADVAKWADVVKKSGAKAE